MNVLLDVTVGLILALSVIIAAKNGFFKTLVSGTAFLLAIIATVIFVTPVRDAMLDSDFHGFIHRGISASVSETVENALEKLEAEGKKKLSDVVFEDEKLLKAVESVGLDTDDIKKELDKLQSKEHTDAEIEKFADGIADELAYVVISGAASLVVFLGVFLVLQIIAIILTQVCNLPVLKQANELMGAVLGLVLGLIRVLVFVSIVNMLLPAMQTSSIGFIAATDPAKTVIFGFFNNFNILSFLI